VDPTVGFLITTKPGARVEAGEPLATIFARDKAGIAIGQSVLEKAIAVADAAHSPLRLITHRVTVDGATEYKE